MSTPNWTHIIVHHTGAEEKDAAQVRRYHLSLGWRDIGYHYVIERDGRVVPGRSLDLPGAHCKAAGMNFKGIGVAVLGNLNNHPPLPPQVVSLESLVLDLRERFGIPAANVLGHREVPGAATDCPGRFLELERLRGRAQRAPGQPAPGTRSGKVYRVQAGAFSVRENAEALAERLRAAGFEAIVVVGNGKFTA